jgi:hypothetical protein
MTRAEIIASFHKLYLENIEKETAKRGKLRGIPMERLKEIHNESIADLVEQVIDGLGPRAVAALEATR